MENILFFLFKKKLKKTKHRDNKEITPRNCLAENKKRNLERKAGLDNA